MNHRVSIIVPMRNAGPFIGPALESLCRQETARDFEIVVVNDASTDRCDETVRSWPDKRVRMVEGGGRGEALAVNTAVENAKGEIIMRCDADDLWPPDRLEWQAAWLDEHTEFGAVCGLMWTTDRGGRVRAPLGGAESVPNALEITAELLLGRTLTSLCTFAIRRECFIRSGGCRPYFRTSPDIDLQFRLAQTTRVWFEPRYCYVYRLHNNSITHTQPSVQRVFFEQTAREFLRQRLETGLDDLMRGCPPAIPDTTDGYAGNATDQIARQLAGASWRAHQRGERLEALRLGMQAVVASGWRWKYCRKALLLIAKPRKTI